MGLRNGAFRSGAVDPELARAGCDPRSGARPSRDSEGRSHCRADGDFAVVDIDTLWRDAQGRDNCWKGRVCKVYTRIHDGAWKLIMHTGVLTYRHRGGGSAVRSIAKMAHGYFCAHGAG